MMAPLCPILIEQPLDLPLAPDSTTPSIATTTTTTAAAPAQVNGMDWRRDENGWIVFKAVPDSGAQVSVADEELAQGYQLKSTAASRAGRGFVSASKHVIPSLGEYDIPTQSPEGVWSRQRWQVAPKGQIAKPLLSIGEECDKNQIVVFSKNGGAIINQATWAARKFPRLNNGTYEIEMRLPPPGALNKLCNASAASGFTRQGRGQ